jgi:hypothetical protein
MVSALNTPPPIYAISRSPACLGEPGARRRFVDQAVGRGAADAFRVDRLDEVFADGIELVIGAGGSVEA